MIDVSITPRRFVAGREALLTISLSNSGPGICTNVVFKLVLPGQIQLLRGNNRVEVETFEAGTTVTRTLQVWPKEPGAWMATSTNFSYRDAYGRTNEISTFAEQLNVTPSAASPRADFAVDISRNDLVYGEWCLLRGCIRNTGPIVLENVAVRITAPMAVDPPGAHQRLGALTAGELREFVFFVRPDEAGEHVPLRVDTTYADRETGQPGRRSERIGVHVRTQSTPGTGGRLGRHEASTVKILFLAASPSPVRALAWSRELREIQEQIRGGEWRDRVRLEPRVDVRFTDIGQALFDVSPRIVHFSGHGSRDGRLYLLNESGLPSLARPEGLADLFRVAARDLECVIVSACYSERLAEAVVGPVDYAIGMRGEVEDDTAIMFSVGFYQGLAAGCSVHEAFDVGRAYVRGQSRDAREYEQLLLFDKRMIVDA